MTEAKGVTIPWDIAIQTKRKIKINRSDIVVKDYKRKTCLLDMSVPTDNNISVKEYNKISKYKDLEIENYHRARNSRSPGFDLERNR